MTETRDRTTIASCVVARTSSGLCQAGPVSYYWAAGGLIKGDTNMLELKALIGLLLIVGLGGIALVTYKLHQLYRAIIDLHCDISVIRLDNSRTMAELRRRAR